MVHDESSDAFESSGAATLTSESGSLSVLSLHKRDHRVRNDPKIVSG
jgi:hypothetical protein